MAVRRHPVYLGGMTIDGLITVLALFAAIYAVLTPIQRLRLTLSWRSQALVALPAFALILALELGSVPPPPCPADPAAWCRWLILDDADPGPARKLAFIVALIWLAAAVAINRSHRPGLGSVPSIARMAIVLIDEERYAEALELVEPNMPLLTRAGRRQTCRQRLHDWLEEFGPTATNPFARFSRAPGQRFAGEDWPEWAARPVRRLAKVTPSHARAEHAASDLLQLLRGSTRLLDYIVERRPYFGLRLIEEESLGAMEFCETYLGRLIASPGSALYQELATNDVGDEQVGYRLPARNRLLHFLFSDAVVAERLSAWQGVGDHVQRLLDGDLGRQYASWLNAPARRFDEDQHRDPTFMGMFFFDVMVTSAAKQGIEYHMWLLYLPHFAEALEKAYDSSGPEVDRDAEFPVRAARLLYELVQTLKGWVGLFDRLPEDSPHRRPPGARDHPSTIPHAAAVALGHTLATVIASERIDESVVETIHEVAVRKVRDLHGDEAAGFRAYLVDALLRGGYGTERTGHVERLADLFTRMDYMLQHEVDDYRAALEGRLGRPING